MNLHAILLTPSWRSPPPPADNGRVKYRKTKAQEARELQVRASAGIPALCETTALLRLPIKPFQICLLHQRPNPTDPAR